MLTQTRNLECGSYLGWKGRSGKKSKGKISGCAKKKKGNCKEEKERITD